MKSYILHILISIGIYIYFGIYYADTNHWNAAIAILILVVIQFLFEIRSVIRNDYEYFKYKMDERDRQNGTKLSSYL